MLFSSIFEWFLGEFARQSSTNGSQGHPHQSQSWHAKLEGGIATSQPNAAKQVTVTRTLSITTEERPLRQPRRTYAPPTPHMIVYITFQKSYSVIRSCTSALHYQPQSFDLGNLQAGLGVSQQLSLPRISIYYQDSAMLSCIRRRAKEWFHGIRYARFVVAAGLNPKIQQTGIPHMARTIRAVHITPNSIQLFRSSYRPHS